jgi:hypothetical protein
MIAKSLQCINAMYVIAQIPLNPFSILCYLIRAAILICNAVLGVGGVVHGLSGASRFVKVYQ